MVNFYEENIPIYEYNIRAGLSGKKTMWAIKSPCLLGCMGYLALVELLISFYI